MTAARVNLNSYTVICFEQKHTCKKFSHRAEKFATKREAYDYSLQLAHECMENAIHLHLYIAGTVFQLDVDRTAAGWVAYQTDIHGTRRIA